MPQKGELLSDDPEKHKGRRPETRRSASPAFRESGRPVEQLLCPRLQVEPRILVGLVPGDSGDALNEIEYTLGLAPFLGQHRLNDLGGLGFGEAALAQELTAVVVGAGDDLFPRRLDAVDEGHGRGIGEAGQRRRRFVGEQ